MKILHLMLGCFYIDNYSYQENYLPKHHKLQGHDVEIVASLFTFDENGKGKWLPKADKYLNEYGIPVTRLEFKRGRIARKLRRYTGLKQELDRFQPDIIFIHGVQFLDIDIVARYCKHHPDATVFADNHSDFSNSATNWLSKHILHHVIWRWCAQKIDPYTKKFYGVLPARVDFLINEYKLPKEKVELLVMGADDESVQKAADPAVRHAIREQYGLTDDDIVIMTGGKIDHNKKQILTLMKMMNEATELGATLLVFGSVVPELQDAFDAQLSDKVRYIGWKKGDEIYAAFAAADIVAFPGLHSVLWEQAVAMGKPCIFRKIDGFGHIDLDGNCLFFTEDTTTAYHKIIEQSIEQMPTLKAVAEKKGAHKFFYSTIAKQSIYRG